MRREPHETRDDRGDLKQFLIQLTSSILHFDVPWQGPLSVPDPV